MNRKMASAGLLLACSSCASTGVDPIEQVLAPYPLSSSEPRSLSAPQLQTENHSWMVGPVSSGSQRGFSWTPFSEFSEMKLEDDAFGADMKFDMRRTGLRMGYSTGVASFSIVGASADTSSQDDRGADTSDDWALGVSGGLTFLPSERVGLGIDLTWLLGQADYQDDLNEGELKYMQVDSRIGVAYRPSADALFALAPIVGVGYRVFDSVATPTSGPMTNFGRYDIDGQGAYVFVGGSLAWRRGPGKTSMALEILAMAGGVEGFMISIPFSYLDLPKEAKATQ